MAKIGKIIDDLTGKTEEEVCRKEQFGFLQDMAQAKSEVYMNRLKLMLENKETVGELAIVGDKAFEYHNGQHVNILPGCDDAIVDEISESFRGNKDVKPGFQALVKQGFSGLIGNTSIGKIEESLMFVYPENYTIVRMDVMAYKYTFFSKDVLVSGVENVFIYAMTKSIVDCKKVGIDYLMYAVVDMLRGDSDEDPSLEEVMPFIKSLQMCWKLLDEDAVPTGASGLLRGAAPTVDASVKERVQKEVEALTPEDVLASAKEGAIA